MATATSHNSLLAAWWPLCRLRLSAWHSLVASVALLFSAQHCPACRCCSRLLTASPPRSVTPDLAAWASSGSLGSPIIPPTLPPIVVFTNKRSQAGEYLQFISQVSGRQQRQCTRAITLRRSAMSVTLHSDCLLCSQLGFSFLWVSSPSGQASVSLTL